jgi:hypothetical protein
MTQNLNVFGKSNEKGRSTDKSATPYATNQTIDPAYEGAAATSGDAFKYSGNGNFIEPASATTDNIIGFANFNIKDNSFEAGDIVEIWHITSTMPMIAAGPIPAGADLEYVVGSPNKVQVQSTGTIIGKARDAAAADGDLIRVAITVV